METKLSLNKLQDDVRAALKSWYEANPEIGVLDYLHLFRQTKLEHKGNTRQTINRIILDALEIMKISHRQSADLLRWRFLDGLTIQAVINRLNIREASAFRKQKEAIIQLSRILYDEETRIREKRRYTLENRLEPPTYIKLVGVDNHLDKLSKVITVQKPPWLLSIESLGGAGKTALADALSRRLIREDVFEDFGWVSAKQQALLPGIGMSRTGQPALTLDTLIDTLLHQLTGGAPPPPSLQEKKITLIKLLKEKAHLIVIDNLETAMDSLVLLPLLRELANPSKFLLTSRHSLQAHADVFCFNLQELNKEDAIRLIRYEAKVRGLVNLENAPDGQLESIYEVTGGNPLALKLVTGQTAILSLPRVLENLKKAQGKNIHDLYTYIYWQTWEMLNKVSQQVFLIMPLIQGGTLDQLLAVSRLNADELDMALQQLVALSLVQVGGTLDERRYTIHRLTETFLLNEAVKWQQLP